MSRKDDTLEPAPARPALTLSYGPHAPQTIECWDAAVPGPARGVAVLVHGGYWRARFDASLMVPLARDLALHGWAVANVEYRRGGNGGGWPETGQDVRSAVAAVAATRWRQSHPGPLVGVGHSVGGQLALLTADLLDAVVALAPVTDTGRTYREGLGENAAAEFFGVSPEQAPEVYAGASPIRQLPLETPALVVHGAVDQRVPVEHSLDYLARARAAGDRTDFISPYDLDHLAAIDPSAQVWPSVREWMDNVPVQAPRLRSKSSA
ncbi:esterase family protein [Arthrobacter crystallopoietes BAB-32]|uniref:Esterase family protein n=1 Tax=Arthrobacter crystallopoietes BAB-32 TaxID=1246476 RepID=N1UZ94_9MICC|nr:alpha/beta fold hydrolase [Arthrobacter crystallopoietes]EMY33152.1 esterase family protein [Arthrobacter crystallopoietes BAB-32]